MAAARRGQRGQATCLGDKYPEAKYLGDIYLAARCLGDNYLAVKYLGDKYPEGKYREAKHLKGSTGPQTSCCRLVDKPARRALAGKGQQQLRGENLRSREDWQARVGVGGQARVGGRQVAKGQAGSRC